MTVFYRKYRPQKFSDLAGQEHIVEMLLAQLTSGKISHGYLFSGPRGSGKTSSARIFAKAINCLKATKGRFSEPCNRCTNCEAITNGSFLDLVEIDAASNRGIDEIRDLREKIKMSPVAGKFKVYIIEEAHMLTVEAFNALLKTLEEPPRHAIFILCTTNPSKLPATIISRLTRFNFIRAGERELVKLLAKISKAEKIKVDDGALLAIAKASDGAYRDAVSILDQLSAGGKKITVLDVERVVYSSGVNMLLEFANALCAKDVKGAVRGIEKMSLRDVDFSLFAKDLMLLFESVLLFKIGAEVDSGNGKIFRDEIKKIAEKVSFLELQNLIKLFLVAESEIKIYPLEKIPLILAVCKYCGDPEAASRLDTSKGVDEKAKIAKKEETAGVEEITKKDEVLKTPRVEVDPKGLEQIDSHGHGPWSSDSSLRGNDDKVSPTARSRSPRLLEIEKKWGKFLEKVRQINAHILALLRSTRPVQFDGVNLTLEVFYKFHKDKLEEPKTIGMLENFLGEIFERKITMRMVLTQRTGDLPKAVKASDVVDVASEDLSALAQEIFSK